MDMVTSTTKHYSNESGEPSERLVSTDGGDEFVFHFASDGHEPVDSEPNAVPEIVQEHLIDEYGVGVVDFESAEHVEVGE